MTVSAPRPKGPPLNALRAFEAAARLGGFSTAADELCVTAGAVAQQIKILEAWVDAPLFTRRSQGVQLTPLGESARAAFSNAFDALGEAVYSLRAQVAPEEIRIATLPSIAQLWLSPRLPQIRVLAPEATLSVTAMEGPPNLRRELFDMALFFEDKPTDSDSIVLCHDTIFPVCSPSLGKTLKHPSDLSKVVCLHDASWSEDWERWSNSVMPEEGFDAKGPVFSLYSLAIEQAKNGAGVAMGHEPLIRQFLNSGELVAPLHKRVRLNRVLSLKVAQTAPTELSAVKSVVVEALKGAQLKNCFSGAAKVRPKH